MVGLLQFIDGLGLENSFIPIMVISIASVASLGTFLYLKYYVDSSLSIYIFEVARMGSFGKFRRFEKSYLSAH